MTVELAVQELRRFLALLDAEDWERLVDLLDADVELADELTATWLRGRDRVAAYLRASAGVVTQITSVPSEVAARSLRPEETLVTFGLRQRYRLDGVEQRRHLTGCAAFRLVDGVARLTLFHLGEVAAASGAGLPDAATGAHAAGADGAGRRDGDGVGARIRAQRRASGLSLRGLATTSGVSASFLSQLERSRASASVATLARLAQALGTSTAELLGDDAETPTLRTGRRGDLGSVRLHELGLTLEAFPALEGGHLESWIARVEPDMPTFAPIGGAGGERFLYVLEGAVRVVGRGGAVLRAGEGAHLRAAEYRIAAEGGAPARYLCTQLR